MSDRATFIRCICENPTDDTVRLVFADFLDETGEPDRAAWIRWQVGANVDFRHELRRGNWCNKSKQCVDLPSSLAWQGLNYYLSQPWNGDFTVSRGFVSHIELPTQAFLDHAAALFAAHPIASVRLTDKRPPPSPVDMHTDETDGFYWQSDAGVRALQKLHHSFSADHRHIPSEIFELMRGQLQTNIFYGNRHYETVEDAISDLSFGCVSYGRSIVTPPLPPLSL